MNGSQTLERAFDILFVLAEAAGTLTVTEISERVSIPESTVYRLLQTMEKNGIVQRKTKGQVGLGLRILDLARSLQNQESRELSVIARPILERLTEQTGETSVLMVRAGLNAVVIQNVESSRFIRLSVQNGRHLPLHLGASSKALLAYEKQRVIDLVFDKMEDAAERDDLLQQLEQIRQLGYSLTFGEFDEDVFGLAVPVFDASRRCIASLTIAGPTDRFKPEGEREMVMAVEVAAEEISQQVQRLIIW